MKQRRSQKSARHRKRETSNTCSSGGGRDRPESKSRPRPSRQSPTAEEGGKQTREEGQTPGRKISKSNSNTCVWLYGRHAVAAAIANPERRVRRVIGTKNALEWLAQHAAPSRSLISTEEANPDAIDALLQEGAVHQGLAILVDPLPQKQIDEVCAPASPHRPVLILDQVTDPQNIGALFRAAAAFGAAAVIVQNRRTPPLSGALAKAAVGAIDKIPCVAVVNISRAISELQDLGYFVAGLAGEAEADIKDLPGTPLALVMGAEGAGLRRLVSEKCDQLFRIPISSEIESLNVSTAAAISLYEARRSR